MAPQKKLFNYFRNHRFLLLLVFLVAGIALPPYFRNDATSNLLASIIFSLVILSGLYAFGKSARFLKAIAGIFLLAIIATWISFFQSGDSVFKLTRVIFFVIVFGTLLIKTLISIGRAGEIDLNTIISSLAGYMLIGYIGGFVAIAISIGYPESFNIPGPVMTFEGIYYSFVTMTTLGYGDITPVGPQARSLSILLSITGPMYIAILIAKLVGKYSSQKSVG